MLASDTTNNLVHRLRSLVLYLTPTIFGFALIYGALGLAFGDRPSVISAGFIAGYGCMLVLAYSMLRRGRLYAAAYLIGGGLIGAVLVMTVLQPYLHANYAIVPLLVAAILLQYAPRQHAGWYLAACALAAIIIAILGEVLPKSPQLPAALISFIRASSIVATIAFTLFMLGQFSRRLSATVERVHSTNSILETQNADLAQANQVITAQLGEQQRLLELVTTLETPAIRLANGLLFAPVVGHLDSRRADLMTARLLQTVHSDRARHVILDMSGLTVMDTAVAQHMIKMIQSMQLLGCQVILSGISSALALTISHLGVALDDVAIVRNPQEALERLALVAASRP